MADHLKTRNFQAVLGMSRLSIPNKLVKARFILSKLTGNPYFPKPKPSLATLQDKITKAENTINTASSHAIGTASPMYAAVRSMEMAFFQSKRMVETVANQDEANGVAIIESAGMTVKVYPLRQSPGFSVKADSTPGVVLLRTQAFRRAAYLYQISSDPSKPDGWKTIITSSVSKSRYKGLTSGTIYYFRTATIFRRVQGPWSQPLCVCAP